MQAIVLQPQHTWGGHHYGATLLWITLLSTQAHTASVYQMDSAVTIIYGPAYLSNSFGRIFVANLHAWIPSQLVPRQLLGFVGSH